MQIELTPKGRLALAEIAPHCLRQNSSGSPQIRLSLTQEPIGPTRMTTKPLTYKDAGVDIAAGNELVERIHHLHLPNAYV